MPIMVCVFFTRSRSGAITSHTGGCFDFLMNQSHNTNASSSSTDLARRRNGNKPTRCNVMHDPGGISALGGLSAGPAKGWAFDNAVEDYARYIHKLMCPEERRGTPLKDLGVYGTDDRGTTLQAAECSNRQCCTHIAAECSYRKCLDTATPLSLPTIIPCLLSSATQRARTA
jgi:hypothetical protein